jgi:hypothetical protein
MRIIHILNHVQEIGNGIVNVAVDLACLQAKSGFEVAVVSAGGEYKSLLDIYGVKHYQLDQRRKPISIIKAAIRYRAIAAEFQPDIVHAHMMTGVVLARLLKGHKYALVSTVFPQAHLYLVGNGPDKQLFEAQAQATFVKERIHFEGFQPEPQRYLISCDIFVLASHRDPFGLVLSEAREAGTAIIRLVRKFQSQTVQSFGAKL